MNFLLARLLAGTMMPDPAAGTGGGGGGGGGGDAAAAAAAAAAGAGGANGAAKPFAETLPEDLRALPVFKDIKDMDGLARSYVNAAKMVGLDKGKVLAIPADDDAKAWDGFYNAQGRPEKVDGYKVPARADGKAYGDADTAMQKHLLPVLHKAGLTQRQINAIVPEWNALMDGNAKATADKQAADMAAAGAALKTEMGAAYNERLQLAQDFIGHVSGELKLGDALLKELDSTKLGNSPAMFKLLAHLGAQYKEDGLLGKGGGGGGGRLSPAEAKQQLAALDGEEKNRKILFDKKDPAHAELVAKRAALYEQAYPSGDG